MMSEAEAALGTMNAKALVTMIADIEAQENGGELLEFFGETANLSIDDTIKIAVGADCSATFAATASRFQKDVNGRVVWPSVTRMKVTSIEGCYGG